MTKEEQYIGRKILWYGNFEVESEIINMDYTGFIIKITNIPNKSTANKYYKKYDVIHIGADIIFKFI